ncbi:MAG: hypothetical protein A2017_21350 [Lentisphaerae bacterium GWF2_44_16]|nr:MAG: hypothetical protein A2017_21350 [Lentisphaerae bacterium GWF2_44_16]
MAGNLSVTYNVFSNKPNTIKKGNGTDKATQKTSNLWGKTPQQKNGEINEKVNPARSGYYSYWIYYRMFIGT